MSLPQFWHLLLLSVFHLPTLPFLFFFPLCFLFVIASLSSLPLSLSIYASCFCPLPPSTSPLVTWATLAVEIKVIKDLPWPPPVGQLNTSPPLVEELESPSQTAQPSPGQTSCDQHHHGGCWCSHCPVSFPSVTPSVGLSVKPSINSTIHQSICPTIHLPIHLSIHPTMSPCVSICLFGFINEHFEQ